MTGLRFDQHVLGVSPYVPDWLGIDRTEFLCLDRNESTRPVPASVGKAISAYVSDIGVHGYPEDFGIYSALADYCEVPTSHLLVTNGSDQAIDITLRCFLRENDELLIATPEFAIFRQVAALTGAVISGIPYEGDDLLFPYEAFRQAARARPRVIAFINPNNPTGSEVDLDFVEEIAVAYPETPVIVDEAYYEFTETTAARLIDSHENIIVFRTFSKAFAMAGLRLGYIVSQPTVVQQLTKIRNPFDVNSLAIAAASAQLAAIDDVRAYAREIVDRVKPTVVDHLTRRGVPVLPGAANFVLVRPEDCDEAVAFLREAGILVRTMSARQLRGTFRVSMGTESEMARFCAVYDDYLRSRGNGHP